MTFKRIAALDLVRGVAALLVAIPHYIMLAAPNSAAAEIVSILAVEIFFALSGFVLAPQIMACVASRRFGDLKIFLIRRWMRTIPPYLVALLAASIVFDKIFTLDFLRYVFYVQNLWAQHNQEDYFPIVWSLSIEEWFYLTFLPLAMLAGRLLRRDIGRHMGAFAICFAGIFGVMRLVFGNFDAWGEDVRRVVLYREDAIAFGFMLYLSVDRFRIRPSLRATAAKSIGPVLLLLVTIALSALAAWAIAVDRSLTAEILFPYLAGALGCAAVFAAFRYAMVFQETPRLRNFCLFSGRVSYSIYLLHLIVALLLQPSIADLPIILQLSIFVVVLLIICSLYYRYFEKPILAARPGYSAAGNR